MDSALPGMTYGLLKDLPEQTVDFLRWRIERAACDQGIDHAQSRKRGRRAPASRADRISGLRLRDCRDPGQVVVLDDSSGMTLAELRAFSSASGLGPAPESSGVRFMVERKTFGRYGCRLELADGVVQTARYDRSN